MCGIRGRKPVTCASLQRRSLSLYPGKWRGVIANWGHFGAHVKWAHFSNSFPNESCVNSGDGYSRGWEGEDAVSYTCSWGDGILWGSRTGRTGLDHSPGTLQVSRSGRSWFPFRSVKGSLWLQYSHLTSSKHASVLRAAWCSSSETIWSAGARRLSRAVAADLPSVLPLLHLAEGGSSHRGLWGKIIAQCFAGVRVIPLMHILKIPPGLCLPKFCPRWP